MDSPYGRTVLGTQGCPRLVDSQGRIPHDEDPLAAARREFAEEMGTPAPSADYLPLGAFRQPSGKVITVFTAEAGFLLPSGS